MRFIALERQQNIIIGQDAGSDQDYSWDFGREAERRNTSVDAVDWTTRAGAKVASQTLLGSIATAVVYINGAYTDYLDCLCTYADSTRSHKTIKIMGVGK